MLIAECRMSCAPCCETLGAGGETQYSATPMRVLRSLLMLLGLLLGTSTGRAEQRGSTRLSALTDSVSLVDSARVARLRVSDRRGAS